VTVGSKRKRLGTGNENAIANGRGGRSSKRRKMASEIGRSFSSTSEESQSEDEMEVDNSTVITDDSNENEEQGIEEVDEEDDDSCKLHRINCYFSLY